MGEFIFRLNQLSPEQTSDSLTTMDARLEKVKSDLRTKLIGCLLTRAEAELLDQKPPQGYPDSSAIRRLAGVLGFAADVVSFVPGSKSLASLGEAGSQRLAAILGAPTGPGHD